MKVQVSEGVRLFCPFGIVHGADSGWFYTIPNNGSSVRNRVFHIIRFKTLYANTMLMTEVILRLFPLDYMFQT